VNLQDSIANCEPYLKAIEYYQANRC